MKRRIQTKKVLVASIGVAVVSYAVACSDGGSGSLSNDGGPADAKSDVPTSGNLMPPKDATTGADGNVAETGTPDALLEDVSSSGNLVPPPDDASVD